MATATRKTTVAPLVRRRLMFYRVNRQFEMDECWYEEKMVRYALSAWVKNVDRCMERLYRGEKVYTPYAYYVARPV
jgi:hypothetical protein